MKQLSDLSEPTSHICTPPSRWKRLFTGVLWFLGMVCLVLLVAWAALHALIVPRINDHREWLQQQATRAIGTPVEIGQIRATGGWLVTGFEVLEVRLLDTQGHEALRLPRVLAALSLRSVLQGGFERLAIDQPELDIRRDAKGQLWVAGLSTQVSSDGAAADWFFSQHEFVVTQGLLHWRDEARHGSDAPVLTLSQVDVVIKNQWNGHDLRLDATPPAALGQRISVHGKFSQAPWGRAGDTQSWSGQVQADLPVVDVSTLRQWVPMDQGVTLQEGRGAMRLSLDLVHGQAVGLQADVSLQSVKVRLAAELEPLALRHITGKLVAKWQPKGLKPSVEISTENLVFDTEQGERWPGGVLRLTWQGDNLQSGTLSADQLDLQALAQVSQRLPLPAQWRALLARVRPQGRVSPLQVSWQTSVGATSSPRLSYTARGAVQGLQLLRDTAPDSPLASLPGVQGAHMDFEFNPEGGKAQVRIEQGSLTLPLGLDDPRIVLDQASAQLLWQQRGEQISVQVSQAQVANTDVMGQLEGSWKTGEGTQRWPGVLDLTASISRAQLAQLHRYLPNSLPLDVRAYVRDAVQQGLASKAKLRIRGDLNDFPFDNSKLGEFRISTQIDEGRYAYVPVPKGSRPAPNSSWPALAAVRGELVLERRALHFKGNTRVEGADHVDWHKVEAHIADLSKPEVKVVAEGGGPLSEVLGVISRTALHELTGEVLDASQGAGLANYKLSLQLPLNAMRKSKVQGSVNFLGNDLQVMPGTPLLMGVKGALQFSEQGFTLKDLKARTLGGEAQIEGGLNVATASGDSPLQLRAKGRASADGLRQARELGWVTRMAQHASGSAAYEFTLGLRRGQPELLITSDLKGFMLNLPAPLNKAAVAGLPLRVSTQLTRESLLPKSRVLQDTLQFSLGRVLALSYVRDLSGEQPQVLRGGIAVGEALSENLPMRDKGVSLNLQLSSLDLDAWVDAMSDLTGVSMRDALRAPSALKPMGAQADLGGAQEYMPNFLALRADQLTLTERMLHNVLVGGTRQADLWRLNLRADELNGSAEVRPANGNTPAQLLARLSYLNIPPSLVPDVERMLSEQPSSIPALDIVVEDLTLRNKKLGRLEIQAVNRTGTNATREWRLNKLNLSMPEASFTASGNWAADGPTLRRTQLNFVLDVNDSGQLLTRLGTPDAVRHGKGRMEGQVSWRGSPITLDYPSMSGKLNLDIEKGQFLKTEPGAARLLGVLNLQALPRRLTLDFSDIFSEGFAFDFVRGDVRIDQGVAFTNNLQMKGVVAGALIEGRADLARETQDLKVVVVPEINAGTYALYMATINPLVGLTSYLAQLVLAKPLVRANTSEFHIDGTWLNPRVSKVD